MGKLKNSDSHKSFLGQIVSVIGGAGGAQMVSLVVAPLSSRIYAPAEYGILGLWSAIIALLVIFSTLRYEAALPVVEKGEGELFIASVSSSVIFCFLLFLGGVFFGYFFSNGKYFLGWEIGYLYLLLICLLLNSLNNIMASWLIRAKMFAGLSASRIWQSLVGAACSLAFGYFGFGVYGLFFGVVVGYIASLVVMNNCAQVNFLLRFKMASFGKVLNEAIINYRFPLYNSVSVFINSASVYIPIFYLSKYFGNESVGFFSMCSRVILLPGILIGGAIAPVFLSRAVLENKKGRLSFFVEAVFLGVVAIDVFFVAFLYLFGDKLFLIAFGGAWERSGVYALAMVPWLFFNFILTPISGLSMILGRQKLDLIFQISLLFVRVISLELGRYYKSDVVLLFCFSISSAVMLFLYFVWLLKLSSVRSSVVFLGFAREFFYAFALVAVFGLLGAFFELSYWVCWIGFLIFAVLSLYRIYAGLRDNVFGLGGG